MRPIAGSTGAGSEGPKRSVPVPSPSTSTQPRPAPTNPNSNNPHAALGVAPSPDYQRTQVATGTNAYQYPLWTQLSAQDQLLYNRIAKEYFPTSEGKTWYEEQFLPYAKDILDKTGIAPDPEYIAIRFAQTADYDISKYYRSNPAISPTSVLYDQPGGRPSADDTSSSSGGGGYGGGGGGGGGRSVSLASPSQAQALLTQFMQNSLGRDPDSKEVRDFVSLLQDYQMNNPNTVSFEGGNVVQSGGIDPGLVAQEFVEDVPGYTEAQSDKYYRTFMSALLGGGA
jgi:hypothetical protein